MKLIKKPHMMNLKPPNGRFHGYINAFTFMDILGFKIAKMCDISSPVM
jgi:hypothetical protein